MRSDLYHAETKRIAAEQGGLLDEARARILAAQRLNALERNGLLHALQVLIENAIGKAKQRLKAEGQPVPVSAYDTFATLSRLGLIAEDDLPAWNAIIGLRNRIVHDYMNVDMDTVLELVCARRYGFVLDFLLAPMGGNAQET